MITPLYDQSAFLGLMPGSASDPEVYGAKVVSLHPKNPAEGRPLVQGFVVLFDHHTGAPTALMDGAAITEIRTAAASGLATKVLAREDVRTHAIFGTGVQAKSHAYAISSARPSIEETVIWGRSKAKADALAADLADHLGTKIRVTESLEDAAACDVLSTVTSVKEPFLMGDWVKPGAHLNLVGPHSLKEREAAAGKLRTRQSDDEITLYKSVGVVAQDLYAAWALLKEAESKNIGVVASI